MAPPTADVLSRVHRALPALRQWIDALLVEKEPAARSVESLGFKRLFEYFEASLLQGARAIAVASIPFPPVASMGVPEFQAMSAMPMSGITFKHVFFALQSQLNETLCFHELIHVVQWRALGVDDFLLTYAAGILEHGYEQSPLEAIAYAAQTLFETHTHIPALTSAIINHARDECAGARALYAHAGVTMGS